ncbi:MAG TPA: phospholipase D-like domain-containing protein [Thermoanaerobaculia bacterium]|nr:phospholipase D-like domain-containing protein [Thermoanaerobaculia bacterium]
MSGLDLLASPWVLALAHASAICLAVGHIVLHKRDVRAAVGWSFMVLVAPFVGAISYWIFGVNRIHRRAARIFAPRLPAPEPRGATRGAEEARATFGCDGMARLLDRLVPRPLVPGNRVTPLVGGAAAYDAMIAALAQARHSITLSSYIFDHDAVGLQFADALEAAHRRGVQIRVLIDAVGARYSLRSMIAVLRRRGVPATPFLRTRMPWRFKYFNLRNHRKICVVDGRVGFTGGINIREGHRSEDPGDPGAVQDVHFRVEGPAVADLQSVFAEDWQFTTGQRLEGDELWFPPLEDAGEVTVRAVADGPDHDLDKILSALLGAIACAERRLAIVTPYFLPDSGLDLALQVAAGRGVEVDILLPERSNLRLVQWASRAAWRWVLEGGCRIWLTPPPFDHTKLMLMDDEWSLLGSANWDPRSLRLNFELNLECHDRGLNRRLSEIVDAKQARARRADLDEELGLPLPRRLLYGTTRLLTPYL